MPIIKSFFKSSYVEKSKSKEIMKFLINLTKNLLKSGKNANDSQVVSTWIFVSVFHFELLLTRRCYLICINLISDLSCSATVRVVSSLSFETVFDFISTIKSKNRLTWKLEATEKTKVEDENIENHIRKGMLFFHQNVKS